MVVSQRQRTRVDFTDSCNFLRWFFIASKPNFETEISLNRPRSVFVIENVVSTKINNDKNRIRVLITGNSKYKFNDKYNMFDFYLKENHTM